MTGEKGLATIPDRDIAIKDMDTRFAVAVRQRELLENYIRERLKPDKHFYKIEGKEGNEKVKPSLTKEGAELICLPHALKAHYNWQSGPEQPPLDDSPYQITVKCEMERTGTFEGEGLGSASSMITKKTGERIQRQRDPGLRHNATLKMACKSAYIAATLNSTAASEFFTQDLEDDQAGDAENGKTEKPKVELCPVHNVPWKKNEKDGKVWYSHKTDDGWCNKDKLPKKPAEPPPGAPAGATPPVQPQEDSKVPPQATEAVKTTERTDPPMKSIGDLFAACARKEWFSMKPAEVLKELGISDKMQISDPVTAWQQIKAIKEAK